MNRRTFLGALGLAPAGMPSRPRPTGLLTTVGDCAAPRAEPFVTGLAAVDIVAGGLAAGDVLVVAAPPCSGKTTLALTIAHNVCESHGVDALYWGPHVQEDRSLIAACRTLSRMQHGALYVRCITEPLLNRDGSLPYKPALLIVDTCSYDARRARDWGPDVIEMLSYCARLATQRRCAVVFTVSLRGFDEPPAARSLARDDHWPLARAAMRLGRIVLVNRPELYDPVDLDDPWLRATSIEVPRQCRQPSATEGGALVTWDARTGLYRDVD